MITKIAAVAALVAVFSVAAFAQIIPPGGRLTLTSNTPVMTSDVVNATTVYYTNYIGDSLPTVAGASGGNQTITAQISLALNSSWEAAGSIHDVFVFYTSGWNICAGPAWASSTSRGTGAGTTQLTQEPYGLWVNTNLVSNCYNGTSDDSFAAGYGLYVGSIYFTAAGETSVQFKPSAAAGGSNNFIGIWNAYNRVPISSLCADSNTGWTYASATWEPLDNNDDFRVTFVDGLGQTDGLGKVTTIAYNATNGDGTAIGIDEDSTTGTPVVRSSYQSGNATGIGASNFAAEESFPPSLGLHYLQAMQSSPNSTTSTFAFNGSQTFLLYRGDY